MCTVKNICILILKKLHLFYHNTVFVLLHFVLSLHFGRCIPKRLHLDATATPHTTSSTTIWSILRHKPRTYTMHYQLRSAEKIVMLTYKSKFVEKK